MRGGFASYRLRLERKKWRIRAFRKRRELNLNLDRSGQIKRTDILLFCTIRNERPRLPFFLQYYRDLGIDHFFFVDNGSQDGGADYLRAQPDVTLFCTQHSYRKSRFGMDWINWLQYKYAQGHWALCVDADEFLVYPFCDTRPIRALTDWLDGSAIKSFGTMTIDMYPKGPLEAAICDEGDDPFATSCWFDSANYVVTKNPRYNNLWIQGGPRARGFFAQTPENAPSLNKIPLVKWGRSYAYVNSTHMLLPRGLNLVYDARGGEKISGCLLHAKFVGSFLQKAEEELQRGEHFAKSREYRAYFDRASQSAELWCPCSEKYSGWRQLELHGLMSKGNWV